MQYGSYPVALVGSGQMIDKKPTDADPMFNSFRET